MKLNGCCCCYWYCGMDVGWYVCYSATLLSCPPCHDATGIAFCFLCWLLLLPQLLLLLLTLVLAWCGGSPPTPTFRCVTADLFSVWWHMRIWKSKIFIKMGMKKIIIKLSLSHTHTHRYPAHKRIKASAQHCCCV